MSSHSEGADATAASDVQQRASELSIEKRLFLDTREKERERERDKPLETRARLRPRLHLRTMMATLWLLLLLASRMVRAAWMLKRVIEFYLRALFQ